MNTLAMDTFVAALPHKPYATYDLAAGLRILPKTMAITMPYIQLNGVIRAFMPFDIDRAGAAFAYEEAGLPAPTFTIINPYNGHAHLLFGLEAPVAFKNRFGMGRAREGPARYYQAIKEAYRLRLRADPAFVGIIVKNPAHERWETITLGRFYELHELADYVDLAQVHRHQAADDYLVPTGPILEGFRNDAVFDLARKWAYGQVRTAASTGDLFDAVHRYCQELNFQCLPPLPSREIRSIARSIARYCWTHREAIFRGFKNRGVMGFTPLPPVMAADDRLEELRRRRALGARYANETRRKKNEERILAAIAKLETQGQRITKAAVSRITGLSRQTVIMAYRHLFP